MVSQTVSAPKREKDPKKRVVITGMGLVSVFGSGIDTFYDKLLEGESGISLIDRFDASSFSVRFAGQIRDFSSKGYIDGKNDRRLDDCWRYCLVAGKRALEDANLGSEVLENVSHILLFAKCGSPILDFGHDWHRCILLRNMVMIVFQSVFHVEMHQNYIFLIFKNYF
jgi:3-oxoacyl-(acyl-carrier-protein) synthase